jgi:outer membrane murein-binding lipoprotein Lpp
MSTSDSFFDKLSISADAVLPKPSETPQSKSARFFPSLFMSPSATGTGVSSTRTDFILPNSPAYHGNTCVLINNPELLCCATVGTSDTKFCCLETAKCTTQSHKPSGKKVIIEPGLYILDKRNSGVPTAAFITPHLDTDNVQNGLVKELLDSQQSITDIRDSFVIAASQEGSQDDQISAIDRSNLKKVKGFKTPSKLKSEVLFKSDNLAETVDSILLDKLPTDDSIIQSYEDPSTSATMIANLLNQVRGFQRAIPTMAAVIDSVQEDEKESRTLTIGTLQLVKQLEFAIGHQTTLLQGQGIEPSLWGALSSTMDRVIKLEVNASVTTKSQSDAFSDLSSQLNTLLLQWKTIIEDLKQKVLNLETHSNSMKVTGTQPTTLFAGLSMPSVAPAPVTVPATAPDSVTAGTKVSPTVIMQSTESHTAHTDADSSSTAALLANSVTVLNDLTERIEKLEYLNSIKGKETIKGAVQLGGYTFTSQNDVGAWYELHHSQPGSLPAYGVFPDPQLLLHWCWIVLSGSNSNSTRDMRDRAAIDLSLDSSYCVESFQQFVPNVFTGKKSGSLLNTSGIGKSRLAQIPDFKSWDNNDETGLRQQLQEALTFVKDSFTVLIEEHFSTLPDLRAFALTMLHSSISFIENLGTYITETYQSFKDVVGDTKSVWSLITFVVEQIFRKDFGQVRSQTIGAINPGCKRSGFRMMYSAIRCVGVANDFTKHGIKNAPAVSASYVRFVIKHSNMGKVSALVEENASLKRKLDELSSSMTAIKATADYAKKTADQAITRINKKTTFRGGANGEEKSGN